MTGLYTLRVENKKYKEVLITRHTRHSIEREKQSESKHVTDTPQFLTSHSALLTSRKGGCLKRYETDTKKF